MLKRQDQRPRPLHDIVADAYARSPLYQKHWRAHGFDPNSFTHDLSHIPLITKKEMQQAPFSDRVQFPDTDGYYFPTISGGTTAQPTMSFMSAYALAPYYTHLIETRRIHSTSVFILRPPMYASAMLGAVISSSYFQPSTRFTLGDSKDLEVSAGLASAVAADMLHTRPSDAIRFAPVMDAFGYSPEQITFIWLTGEPITRASMTLLQRLYPKAALLFSYAMTEGPSAMGLRSSVCVSLAEKGVNAYHLNTTDYIFEVVDGVLVATALHILPTPVIRYVVGDNVRLEETYTCSCGYTPGPIVIVGQRNGLRAYKLGGFTFQCDAIKTVLCKLSDFVTEDFVLLLDQSVRDNRLITQMHMEVRPKHKGTDFMLQAVSDLLRKELVVAGTQTLGVAERLGGIELSSLQFNTNLRGTEIRPPAETML